MLLYSHLTEGCVARISISFDTIILNTEIVEFKNLFRIAGEAEE